MTARTDSFEGLHVLLVTEDEARAQAIAKALRERRAHVGDVRAGAKDPVALRGADLLVIDARRSAAIDARVAEVRSDVRARWASVATIDYTTLVGGEGTVDLRALENVVSRLAGMDKALTERARKEEQFETTLAPLGPTRTLRALALAGPTMHVTLSDGTLHAHVDLAHELLVSAGADRKQEHWDAWSALARVIGMTDANVVVQRRAHATVMNIMEPVDQALETAAQERAQHPEQFVDEVEELSGLRGERRSEPARAAQANGSGAPQASASVRPPPRTLIGVPAPTPPANMPRPSPFRPPAPREPFADTPTDPAAPGLLQRMAQTPANDAEIEIKKHPSEPVLSVERGSQHDDDFGGDSSEYDTGEVTVVADASQLDILRETLGRLDQQPSGEPLTSTMPAPRGQPADEDELELVEALKNASAASAPSPDIDEPARASEPATTSQPAPAAPTPAAPEVVDAPPPAALHVRDSSPRGLRLDVSSVAPKRSSNSGMRAVILIVLAIAAAAAVGWVYWMQHEKQQRQQIKKPAVSASQRR